MNHDNLACPECRQSVLAERQWRPLFSERLAMSHMTPLGRWIHIRWSRFHYWLSWKSWSGAHAPSRFTRVWFWVWRQYRRTWTIR